MADLKFRRQQPIGDYIVDFVCLENRLVIEVDGGQHGKDEEKKRDEARDEWLRDNGYEVLRFCNRDVMKNLEGVLQAIYTKCGKD